MTRDMIRQLGTLALASRLKRLSDSLSRDVARVYDELGVELEPRWFPLLYLLSSRAPLGITEIANELGMSHASVNQIATAMDTKGLLKTVSDKSDARRRLLLLSRRGERLSVDLQPLWKTIQRTGDRLLTEAGVELLSDLDRVEECLMRSSMYKRISESCPGLDVESIQIVDYRPAYKKHFLNLNLEWLEPEFGMEPSDKKMLNDPNGRIIRKGGEILFARSGNQIIGTAALIRHDDKTFEIAKMAVTRKRRREGIGRMLAEKAIDRAHHRGASRLLIFTNRKLKPAGRLYRSLGFKLTSSEGENRKRFRRPTIGMTLELSKERRKQ